MNKKIIFGASSHWTNFLQNGANHYAKEFARHGYQVAFVSRMISPFHWFARDDKSVFDEKKRIWRKGGESIRNENVWHYTPFTFLPFYNKPILRTRWVLENSHRLTFPSINGVLEKNNFKEVEIVWIDNVSQAYLLDLVGHKKSVFRIADDYYAEPESFREKERELIQRVDLTIVPSQLIKLKFKETGGNKILYLPHGVNFEHFYYGSDELPEEYRDISSPRVIYVGAIAGFFDAELIEFAARRLTEVSFILIGRPKSYVDIARIARLANVHLLGARDYEVLPRYLKNADLGIVPFKRTRYTDPLIPIKLYEYMACGLPVVSMKFKEFNYVETLAYLAESHEDFVNSIKIALNEKDRRKYTEFAEANTWEKRYEKMIKELYADEMN